MKRINILLVSLTVFLSSVFTLVAQNERLLLNPKVSDAKAFWLKDVKDIEFLEGELDLSASLEFLWDTKEMKVTVGADVRKINFAFVEPKEVEQKSDEELYKLVRSMGKKWFVDAMTGPEERQKKYFIPVADKGEKVVVLFGEDRYGCLGPVFRKKETMRNQGPIRVPAFRATNPTKGERMLLTTLVGKEEKVYAYWTYHINDFQYRTGVVDLKTTAVATPNTKEAGKVKVSFTAGKDAARVYYMFFNAARVGKLTTDEDLQKSMLSPEAKSQVQSFDPKKDGLVYDIAGLQHGTSYVLISFAKDEYGCVGKPQRITFDLPKMPLLGKPSVAVVFSDVKATSFKVSLKPNKDVGGYYFLQIDIDSPTVWWGPFKNDLKGYLMAYGGDFRTKKPHTKSYEIPYSNMLPDTEYHIYVVLTDKNGQLSDVQDYKIRTLKKGTEGRSIITLELLEIKKDSAKVKCTPNEATSTYRYMCVEKGAEVLYTDGKIDKLKVERYFTDTPSSFSFPINVNSSEGGFVLQAGKDYVAVAMGKNINGEWGDLTVKEFTTLK